jgi:hypothetical protein
VCGNAHIKHYWNGKVSRCIHIGSGVRECAYQTLLEWKGKQMHSHRIRCAGMRISNTTGMERQADIFTKDQVCGNAREFLLLIP